jgi:non-ribosomal peptide synthetase component F
MSSIIVPEHLALRMLDERCGESPDEVWLLEGDRELTFAQIRDGIVDTADRLRAAGVDRGDVVVVEATRSAEFVIGLLGVWSSGALPAPVDASHPEAHRQQLAFRAGARAVLDTRTSSIRTCRGPFESRPGASHVLFTSGSSGQPAAVLVHEEPLSTMLAWHRDTVAAGREDRFALLGGLGHDPVLRDVLASLDAGARLVVPPDDVMSRPGAVGHLLAEQCVTIAHLTPALLEFGLDPALRLPHLRAVLCGGAGLHPGVARRALSLNDELVLMNVYGATETPQVAASHVCTESDLDADVLPVGSGVPGTRVALASDLGLDGRPDEIVVSGGQLATGYLSDDRTTGFGTHPTLGRYYRTGDLGARDDRGRLYVVGRADRQVSVNGYRVALEEIESAALRHPDVAFAQAGTRAGAFGTTLTLTASPRPGGVLAKAEIRAHLRDHLPAYAVPPALTVQDALLTANHKLTPSAP